MAVSSTSSTTNTVIDVTSIVSQLMTVEKQPLTVIANKQSSFQTKLTAFGSLKSALSTFQSSVTKLSSISDFQASTATVADTNVATATANASASAGSYMLEVSKLAQAQTLATAGQASDASAIGTGVISFDFGTISGTLGNDGKYGSGTIFSSGSTGIKSVTIDSTNNSLAGIRDAINKANIGVTASINNDGGTSPYRLVFSSANTGKANSLKISVAGSAELSSLLSSDPSNVDGQSLTETITAQDAAFKVDGISITKATNTVSDVISGVSLTLTNKTSSATKITIARDTTSVSDAIKSFVSAYNTVTSALNNATSYNASTKTSATLNGDSAVRSIQTQIRKIMSSSVTGGSSAYSVLSQVGVTIQKDGSLAVDSTKLASALSTSFNDIAGLFAESGKASDSLASYTSASSKTNPGSYAVNVTQLATKGSVAGTIAAGLDVTSANNTLQVKIDGITATISLEQKIYANTADLAAEIQSKINGAAAISSAGSSVKVSESNGVLTITSDRYGSGSSVDITGGELNLGASNDGLNVSGTINGVVANGSGQTLTGATSNDAEGIQLKIIGGTLGARGTVNYSQGYAFQLDKLIDSLLSTDGLIASRTDGINASIKKLEDDKTRISDNLVTIEARYRAQYSKLDTLLQQMDSTSTYLTQQLSALSKNSG